MTYFMVSTTLQHIQESNKIAVQVGKGILYGISHPCLSRQVHHLIEVITQEQLFHRFLVCNIHAHKQAVIKF